MDENMKAKIDFLTKQLSKLKTVKHDQEVIIEHLAKIQLDLDTEGENDFSSKINDALSQESKNHDALKATIDSYDMQVRRLQSESK